MKRPSFQFYPGDWMNDPALRMCSLGARGLWADMMSIMHDCTPYGHLVVNGKGILSPVLARRVGTSLEETEGLLAELREHGVFAVSEEGWIYSRRMVRDEHNRQVRAAGGVKSLDNPNVPRPKKDRDKDTFEVSPSSPSSSPSPSPKPFLGDFEEAWKAYPKRAGSNSKHDAYNAYKARRTNKASRMEMLEGVRRYAKYIRASGKEGTEYVKMASSFFGPSMFYAEDWELPAPSQNGRPAPTDRRGKTLAATKLVQHIRSRRNPMFPQAADPDWHVGLSEADREVAKAFGVHRILNDTNEGTLVSQLAKALEESENSHQAVA